MKTFEQNTDFQIFLMLSETESKAAAIKTNINLPLLIFLLQSGRKHTLARTTEYFTLSIKVCINGGSSDLQPVPGQLGDLLPDECDSLQVPADHLPRQPEHHQQAQLLPGHQPHPHQRQPGGSRHLALCHRTSGLGRGGNHKVSSSNGSYNQYILWLFQTYIFFLDILIDPDRERHQHHQTAYCVAGYVMRSISI